MVRPASLVRCLAVEVVTSLVALVLGCVLLADLAAHRPVGADGALVAGCELALVGCVVWAWAATTAVVLTLVRGRPARLPGVPAAWRRWVLAACGAALAVGLTTPAHATPGAVQLDPHGARPGHETALLAGLPLPDRAVDGRHRADAAPAAAVPAPAPPSAAPTHAPGAVVTVTAGDTLSALADEHLGSAAQWRALWAANADVVGDDPDLIVPGQRLELPGR